MSKIVNFPGVRTAEEIQAEIDEEKKETQEKFKQALEHFYTLTGEVKNFFLAVHHGTDHDDPETMEMLCYSSPNGDLHFISTLAGVTHINWIDSIQMRSRNAPPPPTQDT